MNKSIPGYLRNLFAILPFPFAACSCTIGIELNFAVAGCWFIRICKFTGALSIYAIKQLGRTLYFPVDISGNLIATRLKPKGLMCFFDREMKSTNKDIL